MNLGIGLGLKFAPILFETKERILKVRFLSLKKSIIFGFCLSIALNPKTVFASPSSVDMDKISDYALTVSYRTGDLLCYVLTYYKEGEAPSLRMVTSPIPYDPFVKDGKYQLGVFEWRYMDRNTFQSAFLTQHEHEYFYMSLHSHYVKNLIESDGFKDAIYRCARTKNLDFEDLLERITNAILFVDGKATVRGRGLQMGVMGTIGAFVFRGAMAAIGFLGRITGLGRLGVAGTTLALFQREDSAYYQIWKAHQERIQEADAKTQNLKEFVEHVSQMDAHQVFWYNRWQQYNRLISNVQNATSADAQTALINLYFIDYWILQRWLDAQRDERMEAGESNESAEELKLNSLTEMFAFRKRELDRQLEKPDPTKQDIVAGLLLEQSERDPHFRCSFQDKSMPLCRLHLLLLARSRNTLNNPQQIQELQTLEEQFASETFL